MSEILLIQPPIQDFYLTRKRTMPYGLACLAGALEKAGFAVTIFDALATQKSKPLPFPDQMAYLVPFYGQPDSSPFALFHQYRHFGYSYQHIERIIRESGAYLVGISSLFTPYSAAAEKVAAIAKTVDPGITVVMGGHHPTALPYAAMQCTSVDYVLRGEAEETLPVLAAAVKSGRSPAEIPGLVRRLPDGRLQASLAAGSRCCCPAGRASGEAKLLPAGLAGGGCGGRQPGMPPAVQLLRFRGGQRLLLPQTVGRLNHARNRRAGKGT